MLNNFLSLPAVLTFRFEKAEYYTSEDTEFVNLTILKEGLHELPATIEVQTHSQSSKHQALGEVWLLGNWRCGRLHCND